MPPGTAKRQRLCLGSHLSVAGGVSKAVEGAIELGLESLQIFTKNASRWKQQQTPEDEVARFLELRQEWGAERRVVSHDSYLINIGSPKAPLRNRSRAALIDELERAERLHVDYLVMHPGAHVGSGVDAAIANIVKEIKEVFKKVPHQRTRLLLECTAGAGTTMGRSFEELAQMLDGINYSERVGICLDTCHLYAAGYDIRAKSGYEETMAQLDEMIGAERVHCWHINDSRGELGSNLDRHEHIGEGQIGKSGFRQLLKDDRFFGIPKILETPKDGDMDEVNLATLYAL